MLTICTFNIQNDYRKYDILKSKEIVKFLKRNKIDILSLQEVYPKVDKDLKRILSDTKYSISGKYRFFLNLFLKRVNEKTPIITNKKVLSTKTYHLPFLPSTLRRIITKVEIEDNEKVISIYNTHLDYKYLSVRKRQLKKVLNIIKNDKNPIILTGDFNLKNNNIYFKKFISELEKLNIKHIDILDNTLKISKYHRAIDHIFISDSFKLKSKKRVTNLDISDHYPIIIKVENK